MAGLIVLKVPRCNGCYILNSALYLVVATDLMSSILFKYQPLISTMIYKRQEACGGQEVTETLPGILKIQAGYFVLSSLWKRAHDLFCLSDKLLNTISILYAPLARILIINSTNICCPCPV